MATHTDEKGNPKGLLREPPEVKVKLPEMRDLPKRSTSWEEIATKFLPVNFLLLTVKDCEQLSCLSFLQNIKRGYLKTLGPVYFGFYGQKEPKLKIAVIKCFMGCIGSDGSTVVIYDAVPILEPKAVICVGYCGSLNEKKADLGDVIVSSKLIIYAFRKDREDGIEEDGLIVHLNKRMASLIKRAAAGWKAPLIKEENLMVRRDGVFLSGSEVLHNLQRLKELQKRFGQGTAIEMEGEGLYTSANDLGIDWLIVKGVSDFVDGRKSSTDSWRPFASVMAASFVFHMLNDLTVFEEWPHHENAPNRKKRSSTTGDIRAKVTKGESYAEGAQPGTSARVKARSTLPRIDAPTTSKALVKAGGPSRDELEELSEEIIAIWMTVARRLGFKNSEIVAFEMDNKNIYEQAYCMLMAWRRKEGSNATYKVLYDALCHKLVNSKLLAKQFCCN